MAGNTLPPTYAHLRTFFSQLAGTLDTALNGGDSLPAGPESLEVSAGFPVWWEVMHEAPAQFEAAVAKVMPLLGVEKSACDLGPAFMVMAQAVRRWMLLRVMVCRMEKADDLPARTMMLDGVDHTLWEIQGWLRRVAAGLTAWEKDPEADQDFNFTLRMTPVPGLEELARWFTALQQPAPPPDLDVEAIEQLMAAALGAQGGVAMGMGALSMLDWLPW